MKVRISLTVDIDPEAWTLDFGVAGAADIREDVKAYCAEAIYSQLEHVGMLKGRPS